MAIRIGTSGYSFKDWKGRFYPENLADSKMLEYYAQYFNTVEINSTYYAIPSARTFESMDRRTPKNFKFTVKAHSDVTHARENVKNSADALISAIRPIVDSGKFAGILAQFPYSFKLNKMNVSYLELVREVFDGHPVTVEFRHNSWIRDDTFDLLRKLDLSYSCVDEPDMPGLVPPVVEATGKIGYVRLHGRNARQWWSGNSSSRYDYLYSQAELLEWKPKIEKLAAETVETFIFFNNCHAGQAADNAKMMLDLFDARS